VKRGSLLPRWLTSEHPLPWLFPVTSLLIVFGLYPVLYSLWLSFFKRNPATRKEKFLPSYNWNKLLADDRVWDAVEITLTYAFIALALQLILGMLIALLLDTDRKGFGVLRALMTLPLVVPPAVTGMMFLLMYDSSFGVISNSLYALNLLSPDAPILGTSATALWGVIVADVWQWTPFMVLIMLAGLRALPREPFEAASIDVIALAILIRGIDLFRIFDYVKVMTDSGPGTATETLTAYAGTVYFKSANFPYASAVALATLIVVLVVSSVFIKVFKIRF